LTTSTFLIFDNFKQAKLFISTPVIKLRLKIFFIAKIFNPILGPNSIMFLILKAIIFIF
jgi:hypothetical protein